MNIIKVIEDSFCFLGIHDSKTKHFVTNVSMEGKLFKGKPFKKINKTICKRCRKRILPKEYIEIEEKASNSACFVIERINDEHKKVKTVRRISDGELFSINDKIVAKDLGIVGIPREVNFFNIYYDKEQVYSSHCAIALKGTSTCVLSIGLFEKVK